MVWEYCHYGMVGYTLILEFVYPRSNLRLSSDRWTELWLNEGFASFVEHISVEKQFPEWKIWNQFVDDFFSSAMRLDSLKR